MVNSKLQLFQVQPNVKPYYLDHSHITEAKFSLELLLNDGPSISSWLLIMKEYDQDMEQLYNHNVHS